VDRTSAARTLGVAPTAPASEVERAFRRLAHDAHPDRFPPGSEAAEDATYRMRALVEARRTLLAVPDVPAQPQRASGDPTWAWAEDPDLPRYDDPFPTERAIDRRMRAWGLAWGGFLMLSAILCALVGATQPTNDALPLWSPALALGGVVALTVGVRAGLRLRDVKGGRARD
jgi:hypothetical protein